MGATPVPTKHWARLEYERLVDRAVFQPGDRVELVGGQLVVREPQGSPHAVAALLVEVADASLAFDRQHKGSLYLP